MDGISRAGGVPLSVGIPRTAARPSAGDRAIPGNDGRILYQSDLDMLEAVSGMKIDWPGMKGLFPPELDQVLIMRNMADSSRFKTDDAAADLRTFSNFSLRYGGKRAFSEDFIQKASAYYARHAQKD